MISQESFVKTMAQFESLTERINDVDRALRSFGDNNGLFIPELYDIVIFLLESQLPEPENHWIEYFLFETEAPGTGLIWEHGEDNPPTIIGNWNDVYEFLMRKM